MIQVEGLTKLYGEFIAVNELSFSVQPGEVMGLVGPNGAGKTTTLRCLAGIIPPTRGTVRVGGHDIVRDAIAAKKQLAFFTDEPRLFDYLTVWQHLNFVARIYQVRRLRKHRPRTAGGARNREQAGRAARRTVPRHETKARHRLRPAALAEGDLFRRTADRPGSPRHPPDEGFHFETGARRRGHHHQLAPAAPRRGNLLAHPDFEERAEDH